MGRTGGEAGLDGRDEKATDVVDLTTEPLVRVAQEAALLVLEESTGGMRP